MKSLCLCVLVLCLQFVCALNEPCPVKLWDPHPQDRSRYGTLYLTIVHDVKPLPISTLKIVVTMATDDLPIYMKPGALTFDNTDTYNGSYFWHFPADGPHPKVTEVSLNGDIICSELGDKPTPTQNVTKLTFQATWKGDDQSNSYSKFQRDFERITIQYQLETTPQPILLGAQNTEFPLATESTTTTTSTQAYSEPATSTRATDHYSNRPLTTNECGVVAGGNERFPLISRGKLYERGQVPWLVAIYRIVSKNLHFICGGTLVSDRHVITAAHCMRRRVLVSNSEIVVKVGVHSLNDWSDDFVTTRKLIAATIHEGYDPDTLQNDIMILTLDKRVQFNRYSRPACLWSTDTELAYVVGAIGVVAGWGARAAGDIDKQDQPQMVRVPIVSTKECRASKSVFHSLTYNNTLCAGDRNGEGPCTGDSGGGLYVLDSGKWRLRGVVSVSVQGGALGCDLNEYVVYTDTAQFLPWIRSVLSVNYHD